MQLRRFEVDRLFGLFDHAFDFPEPSEDDPRPAVVVLHGPNGVGKTTILRMLEGMMTLSFGPFRRAPFAEARLTLNTGSTISVARESEPDHLLVTFDGHATRLNATHSGSLEASDRATTEKLRSVFFEATRSVKLELLETRRIESLHEALREAIEATEHAGRYARTEYYPRAAHQQYELFRPGAHAPELPPQLKRRRTKRRRGPGSALSSRVSEFIREAQLNHRRFFLGSEAELFPKMLERLSATKAPDVSAESILNRLQALDNRERKIKRLGLAVDAWDFQQLAQRLQAVPGLRDYALAAVDSYAEFLESRIEQRWLVAERLFTFEAVLERFLQAKTVRVNADRGLEIESLTGAPLAEWMLSSGEYHLLYLMVSALTTQRRGTVLLIDEPEMSMHLAWQRQLVRGLLECASKAQPQLILATHSPDIAAGFEDQMVDLGE